MNTTATWAAASGAAAISNTGRGAQLLASAAAFWLDVYHCDGLRMDAVSRALYWQGDSARGVNQGAVEFLEAMNEGLHARWPAPFWPRKTAPTF